MVEDSRRGDGLADRAVAGELVDPAHTRGVEVVRAHLFVGCLSQRACVRIVTEFNPRRASLDQFGLWPQQLGPRHQRAVRIHAIEGQVARRHVAFNAGLQPEFPQARGMPGHIGAPRAMLKLMQQPRPFKMMSRLAQPTIRARGRHPVVGKKFDQRATGRIAEVPHEHVVHRRGSREPRSRRVGNMPGEIGFEQVHVRVLPAMARARLRPAAHFLDIATVDRVREIGVHERTGGCGQGLARRIAGGPEMPGQGEEYERMVVGVTHGVEHCAADIDGAHPPATCDGAAMSHKKLQAVQGGVP